MVGRMSTENRVTVSYRTVLQVGVLIATGFSLLSMGLAIIASPLLLWGLWRTSATSPTWLGFVLSFLAGAVVFEVGWAIATWMQASQSVSVFVGSVSGVAVLWVFIRRVLDRR